MDWETFASWDFAVGTLVGALALWGTVKERDAYVPRRTSIVTLLVFLAFLPAQAGLRFWPAFTATVLACIFWAFIVLYRGTPPSSTRETRAEGWTTELPQEDGLYAWRNPNDLSSGGLSRVLEDTYRNMPGWTCRDGKRRFATFSSMAQPRLDGTALWLRLLGPPEGLANDVDAQAQRLDMTARFADGWPPYRVIQHAGTLVRHACAQCVACFAMPACADANGRSAHVAGCPVGATGAPPPAPGPVAVTSGGA